MNPATMPLDILGLKKVPFACWMYSDGWLTAMFPTLKTSLAVVGYLPHTQEFNLEPSPGLLLEEGTPSADSFLLRTEFPCSLINIGDLVQAEDYHT